MTTATVELKYQSNILQGVKMRPRSVTPNLTEDAWRMQSQQYVGLRNANLYPVPDRGLNLKQQEKSLDECVCAKISNISYNDIGKRNPGGCTSEGWHNCECAKNTVNKK